jgi:hypothetical protein
MHMPGYGYERGFDFTRYFRGQQFDFFYRNDPCDLDPDRFHKPAFDPRQPDQELPASLHARHELTDYLPLRQKWQGEEDQYAAKVCRAAMDWLEDVDRERPFLLWLDCFDPHEPWDPPSVWTCTPGSVAEIPEVNELYDRRRDPFQLNNLLEREPEAASEVHAALMKFMLSLRASQS